MKTITQLSYAFFLFASLALASCSGDDDNGNPNNNGGGNASGEYVKAKVDGADFASTNAADVVQAIKPMPTTLSVQGSNNTGEFIQIMINNYNGAGTYTLNEMQSGYIQYGALNPQGTYSSIMGDGASGEVTVTSDNGSTVEGTFHFVGKLVGEGDGTKNVTEGKFKANF